jgi:hypothetical protein
MIYVVTRGYPHEGERLVGVRGSLDTAKALAQTDADDERVGEWEEVSHDPFVKDAKRWWRATDPDGYGDYEIYEFEEAP